MLIWEGKGMTIYKILKNLNQVLKYSKTYLHSEVLIIKLMFSVSHVQLDLKKIILELRHLRSGKKTTT